MSRLVLPVVVALSIAAQDAAAERDPVAEAESAVAAGELAKAAAIIEAGLVAQPKDLKLLFLRGVVELQRRRFASALAAYETYLAAGPRGANARKAKAIIANLAAVKTTFLEVAVTGGAADVYVDDKSLGVYCVANAVCTVGMMPGRYRLLIEGQSGGGRATRDVVIKVGQKTRVVVELEAPKVPLTVRASPADAEIAVDGSLVGSGERTVEVVAGRHQIEVRRSGFAMVRREVTVADGRPLTVEIALPERVPLAGLPAGVEVSFELDGKTIALSGGAVAVPSDGRAHQLKVRAPGYREAVVSVRAGRSGEPLAIALVRDTRAAAAPGWSRPRKIALISLLAAGGVGIAAGSVLGLQAIGKRDDAEAFCDEQTCTREGIDLLDASRSRANLSNVAFAVGAAAAIGAGIVWLTAPSESEGARLGAAIGPGGGHISVRVGF